MLGTTADGISVTGDSTAELGDEALAVLLASGELDSVSVGSSTPN